ncbi:plectin [Gracilaria domingensis]|nr:plectin [Gracilaria domingensis]
MSRVRARRGGKPGRWKWGLLLSVSTGGRTVSRRLRAARIPTRRGINRGAVGDANVVEEHDGPDAADGTATEKQQRAGRDGEQRRDDERRRDGERRHNDERRRNDEQRHGAGATSTLDGTMDGVIAGKQRGGARHGGHAVRMLSGADKAGVAIADGVAVAVAVARRQRRRGGAAAGRARAEDRAAKGAEPAGGGKKQRQAEGAHGPAARRAARRGGAGAGAARARGRAAARERAAAAAAGAAALRRGRAAGARRQPAAALTSSLPTILNWTSSVLEFRNATRQWARAHWPRRRLGARVASTRDVAQRSIPHPFARCRDVI